MRLTEIISFLQKNPTGDELTHFTHLDIDSIKAKMEQNKELRKFIRDSRKAQKRGNRTKTEVIDIFDM